MADSSEVIDRSAPQVQLRLKADGAEEVIDLADRLITFTFEDSDTKTDKATFQLDNRDLSFFESQLVIKGAVVDVSWGYPGRMSAPRKMVIKSIKGFDTLRVEAHDEGVLLNKEQRCQVFEGMTRSDVAKQIASDNGFSGSNVDVEETEEVFEVINQIGETDARFLTRLARREGFVFFVDDSGFHWHSRRFGDAPIRTYVYFTDPNQGELFVPQLESQALAKPGRVRVRGRNPMKRQDIEAKGSDADTERDTLAEVVEVVDPESGATEVESRNSTESVRNSSASNPERAQREANARYRRSNRTSVKMKFPAVGDPEQRAKEVAEFLGITSLLEGKFYVSNVKHTISAGSYRMVMSAMKDGVGRREGQTTARKSGGKPNDQETVPAGELKPVEEVNEFGETRIVYKSR